MRERIRVGSAPRGAPGGSDCVPHARLPLSGPSVGAKPLRGCSWIRYPTGERLPAALGSLRALLLLPFLLFFLLFSLSPSSPPSPPPLPLVLCFPLLFPLLLPLLLFLLFLLLLSALAPSPGEVSCSAIGRGSPRAMTSWGGETPCRDVIAGWYSTCVARGGGGDCDSPRAPRGIPCRVSCSNPAPYSTLVWQIPCRKSLTAPRAPLEPAPLDGSPALQPPAPLPQHPLHPLNTPNRKSSINPVLGPPATPTPSQKSSLVPPVPLCTV